MLQLTHRSGPHDSTRCRSQEFKKTQNCVACCNREGLLKFLEGQQSALEVRAAGGWRPAVGLGS